MVKNLLSICAISLSFFSAAAVIAIDENKDPSSLNRLNKSSESASLIIDGVKDTYYRNEVIDVSKCKLKYNNEIISSTNELLYPSGKVMASKSSYILDEEGIYKLTLKGLYNSQVISCDYKIKVIKKNFELSSESDSCTMNYTYDDHTGNLFSLSSDSVVKYNTLIDVSKMTADDILFEMYVIPTELGKSDFDYFELTLTDVYDKNNYLTFSINNYDDYRCTYYKSGATNQPKEGYEASKDRLHIEDNWGSVIDGGSFCGTTKSGSKNIVPYQLRLDYSTLSTYAGARKTLIIDHDDTKYFTSVWNGFTTGEVELSFFASNFASSKNAQILVSNIANENLSIITVEDTQDPNIEINFLGYDINNLPKALVGQKYPIFDAKFSDNSFNFYSDISVYGNYNSSTQYDLMINDNSFAPDRKGIFYIVYTATDYSGNTKKIEIPIEAVNEWNPIVLDTDGSYFENAYETGDVLTFPSCSVSGGFGESKYYVTIELNGEIVETLTSQNLTFRPLKQGKYTISYVGEDFIGKRETTQFTLNVNNATLPVFLESPIYEKYLIAGSTYKFADFCSYDFSTGSMNKINANIKVKDSSGEKEYSNNSYTPNKNDTEIKVCYVAKNANGQSSTEFVTIPVINTKDENNLYDLTKYFYGNGLNAVATSNNVTLVTNGKVDFINKLLADGLSFDFSLESSCFKAEYLRISLTDYLNDSQMITIDFKKMPSGESSNLIRFNEGEWRNCELKNPNEISTTISFDNLSSKLSYGQTSFVYFNRDLHGNEFSGFDSGMVYLSMEFVNPTANSELKVNKISKQTFSLIKYDLQKPLIVFDGEIKYAANVNEKYRIVRALCLDVLDPNVTFHMTVTDPNGNVVKDVNGTLLNEVDPTVDYYVELKEFGNYLVSYYAEDSSFRKETNIGYSILVFEFNKPVITLEEDPVYEGKVNENILIPKAKATDIEDGEVEVTTYIRDCNNKLIVFTDKYFKTAVAGKYYVSYLAYDSSGNFASYSYEITVK